MKIEVNYCKCHPETCCHFDYYIYKDDGSRLVGSNKIDDLVLILKGLETNEN